MDSTIKKYISGLEFGNLQKFGNMAVLPLLSSLNGSPDYLTLKEALEMQKLKISEVSEGGSVPELKVKNEADIPVLLLDGEEVVGAKQNRVLNTSILLKEKSESIIPVSCTEQGRWSYSSKEFSDSGTVMSSKIRSLKADTVSQSLEISREYRSNQSAVWDAIDEQSEKADSRSETGAMQKTFESKKKDLDDYLKAFICKAGQKGLLTFIGNELAGFDFISLEKAYRVLHPKLVKSYAMDAILKQEGKDKKYKTDEAKTFIDEILKCTEKKYESVGKGWDYRFKGEEVVGSALKFGRAVIHMAFFVVKESDKTGNMSGYRRRTGFRTR
ncbi:ARPP-1 family domain-containing protein [Acidobacteriota bacterium]